MNSLQITLLVIYHLVLRAEHKFIVVIVSMNDFAGTLKYTAKQLNFHLPTVFIINDKNQLCSVFETILHVSFLSHSICLP